MDLPALRIFVKVAELASFTRAADQLGLPKARVSTAVQQLEATLGVRLLHRTTRSVRLTQDGEQFVDRANELLADAEELNAMFQQAPAALRGRVRVDMPAGMARHVVIPRLGDFFALHPGIEVELSTNDRQVDLVHEAFDCVLRVGPLRDSGLVARPLGEAALVNCASPGYLRAYGMPTTLDDLDHHKLVHYAPTLGAGAPGWEYHDGERYRFRPMSGFITVNGTDAYQAACLAGLGMIQAPRTGLEHLLDDGSLVEVMPGFRGAPMPVSLLYPNRRNLAKRVQAMLDWLAALLAPRLGVDAARPSGRAAVD